MPLYKTYMIFKKRYTVCNRAKILVARLHKTICVTKIQAYTPLKCCECQYNLELHAGLRTKSERWLVQMSDRSQSMLSSRSAYDTSGPVTQRFKPAAMTCIAQPQSIEATPATEPIVFVSGTKSESVPKRDTGESKAYIPQSSITSSGSGETRASESKNTA